LTQGTKLIFVGAVVASGALFLVGIILTFVISWLMPAVEGPLAPKQLEDNEEAYLMLRGPHSANLQQATWICIGVLIALIWICIGVLHILGFGKPSIEERRKQNGI